MNSTQPSRTQEGRRALRHSLAWCSRHLPDWLRGRFRVGSNLDRVLARSGYRLWREDVVCSGGVRMSLDTEEPQQQQIYWTGSYDRLTSNSLADLLPDNGVLVDVGAGVGSVCLFAAKACAHAGKSVEIHAVEPLAQNYERLLQNVHLNGLTETIVCHRLAFGAVSGTLNLSFRGGPGAAAVARSNEEVGMLAGDRAEEVACESLDQWTVRNRVPRVDVLKVDIEGAEPLMFRGGTQTIEKFMPVIIGEFNEWWAARHGLSIAADCFEPLWRLGYRAFRPDHRRRHWQAVVGRPGPGPEMEDTLWLPPGR